MSTRILFPAILIAVSALPTTLAAQGGTQGSLIEIDVGEERAQLPTASFDSARDRFLVLSTVFGTGAFGRFVNADGILDGATFLVDDCGIFSTAAYNAIADTYVAVMTCDGSLVAQQLSADGLPRGPQRRIVGADPSGASAIAWNALRGEFLVVWQDLRDECCEVYAQRLAGDGSLMGPEMVISDVPGRQVGPQVVANSVTGEFLVAWSDCRADVSSFCVELNAPGEGYGRVVAPSGGIGPEARITDFTRSRLGIAYNRARNSYMAVWNDTQNGNAIMGRSLGADAAPIGPSFLVSDALWHSRTSRHLSTASRRIGSWRSGQGSRAREVRSSAPVSPRTVMLAGRALSGTTRPSRFLKEQCQMTAAFLRSSKSSSPTLPLTLWARSSRLNRATAFRTTCRRVSSRAGSLLRLDGRSSTVPKEVLGWSRILQPTLLSSTSSGGTTGS